MVLIVGAGLVGAYLGRALKNASLAFEILDPCANVPYLEKIIGFVPTIATVSFQNASTDLLKRYSHIVLCARPSLSDGYLSDHLIDTILLREWSQSVGGGKLFYISSLAVYGRDRGVIDESVPAEPVSEYGKYKLREERLLFGISEELDHFYVFRSTGLFGALAFRKIGRTSAPAIDFAIRDHLAGKCAKLLLWHHFDQYLYAMDLAELVVYFIRLEARLTERIFNVGSGEVLAPTVVAAALEDVLESPVLLDVATDSSPSTALLSIKKVKQIAGFRPSIFKEALHRTFCDLKFG